MENIKILLITNDFEYGDTFIEAINRNSKFIIFELIKGENDFINNESVDRADIVIVDIECEYNGKCIRLVEKCEDSGELSIFRYGQVEYIVDSIIEGYALLCGKKLMRFGKESSELIAITSFNGGVGCSTIVKALGQYYAIEKSEKVLIFSMKVIDDFSLPSDSLLGKNKLAMLIYYIINNREAEASALGKYIIKTEESYYVFVSESFPNTLNGIENTDFQKFITFLIGINFFDKIIVDIGQNICENAFSILDLAKVIGLVNRDESANSCAFNKMIRGFLKGKNKLKIINAWNSKNKEYRYEFREEYDKEVVKAFIKEYFNMIN